MSNKGMIGAGAPAHLAIDFNDPAQNLEAFVRVFVDTNPDNIAVGWFKGPVYGVIGDSSKLHHLLAVEGIGITHTQPMDDGSFRIFNRELVYYKDLATDEFIDEWDNPLNGKHVETVPMRNMTVNAEIAPMMKMDIEGTMIEYPFLPPWEFMNDQALSTFEIHASVPSELQPDEWPLESAGPTTRISEMFMRYCRIDDLANKNLTSVPYVGVWTRLSSWYPWMFMGQQEGHLYFRAGMTKYGKVEDLPRAFLDKAEKDHPEYLVPPTGDSWGQPNDSTFNMYKKEHKPMSVK